MNGLIPALLIVLLAEAGAPLGVLSIKRTNIVIFVIAVLVFAAAGIGWQFSTVMAADARSLMLGVLLIFAASGQLWIGKSARDTTLGTAFTISRSPAPGLAFGLAAYFGEPVTPAIGALFAVAATAGFAVLGVVVPPLVRRIAGSILLISGLFLALRAFSFV